MTASTAEEEAALCQRFKSHFWVYGSACTFDFLKHTSGVLGEG